MFLDATATPVRELLRRNAHLLFCLDRLQPRAALETPGIQIEAHETFLHLFFVFRDAIRVGYQKEFPERMP